MATNPWEDVKLPFNKNGEISDKAQFFMINRILSFHGPTLGLSNWLDKFIYTVDGSVLKRILEVSIDKQRVPFFHYIRKPEEKKSKKYDEIIQEIRQFFHWSDKEYGVMLPLLDKLLEDDKKLTKALEFFGAEKKLYDKYKVEFNKEEAIVCQGNLKQWTM